MGTGYNLGTNASPSNIDAAKGNKQLTQYHYDKMAIIEIADEMILSKMSGTMAQPKNSGKEVVKHRYIPLLNLENAGGAGVGLDTAGLAYANGNLYGSSRGTGFIESKLPNLTENSGRVNKVGFSRKEVRGKIVNRGFFYEFTKDELNFDSDAKLKQYITTEAVRGANQINEDVLAIELIKGAGVNYYAGATAISTNVGINQTSVPTIQDLIRLDTLLDDNKCPRDTKIIAGSTLVDTKVVQAARFMFISPDMKMDFMKVKALNGVDDAFTPIEKYAAANKDGKYVNTLHGEIGKVGPFRLVVHPKMVRFSGKAADSYTGNGASGAAWTNAYSDFRNDGTNFEVYANLVVGSEAFTHIAFEFGAGTQQKFNVTHMSAESLRTRENPYAKTEMSVIEWWNGILIERPEWVAVYHTASRY